MNPSHEHRDGMSSPRDLLERAGALDAFLYVFAHGVGAGAAAMLEAVAGDDVPDSALDDCHKRFATAVRGSADARDVVAELVTDYAVGVVNTSGRVRDE